MLTATINNNCKYIAITGDEILSLFNDKTLTGFEVNAKLNCCDDLVVNKTVSINYSVIECNYVTYNLLGSDYRNLKSLLITINGSQQELLDQTYDLSSSAGTVKALLESYDFIETATVTLNKIILETKYTSFSPVQAIYEKFDDDSCYIQAMFVCINTDVGCDTTLITHTLPDGYTYLNTFYFERISDGAILTVEIANNDNFILYDENLVSGADPFVNTRVADIQTVLNGAISLTPIDASVLIEYAGNRVLTFTGTTGDVYKFIGVRRGFDLTNAPIITLAPYTSESYDLTSCSDYTTEFEECEYKVTIAKDTAIQSISILDNGNVYPVVISEGKSLPDDLVDFQTQFTDYGTITIVEDGDDVEIIIVPSDPTKTPYAITLFDGISKEFTFVCSGLFEIDDADVQFNGNSIRLYPGFFSQSGEKLADALYNIKFKTITDTEKIEYSFCKFVDCDLKCIIANIENIDDGLKAMRLYEIVKMAEDCTDCECENACTFYESLLKHLKNVESGECEEC